MQVEEIHYVGFLSKFLETKMMQILRFKHGQVCVLYHVFADLSFLFFFWFLKWSTFLSQIYNASVSVFLGGNKHSRIGDVRGDVSISFSCDPEISSKLVYVYVGAFLNFLFIHGPISSTFWSNISG